MKIILLSSDTTHHRYFINSLLDAGIELEKIVFETGKVKPKFKTGPLFESDEEKFEKNYFFKSTSYNLPNIEICKVKNINSEQVLEMLRRVKPDLGIVFGTGLIKKNVISSFKDGLINVHRGIAQKYRGLDSDLWAIYHQDYKSIGVTIHLVEEKLDTGAIIYQKEMKLIKNMKIFQIRYYTTLIATDLVKKTIADYSSGALQPVPQEKIGRYYSFMPLDLKSIVTNRFNLYCKNI